MEKKAANRIAQILGHLQRQEDGSEGRSFQTNNCTHERESTLIISQQSIARPIMNSPFTVPTPARMSKPNSKEVFFYRIQGLMLLYNEDNHTRLKETYPKLNVPGKVQKEFAEFARKAVETLLDSVKDEEVFDFMKVVARPLPWILLNKIVGIPEKDIARVAELLTILGYFVGIQFSKDLMDKAMVAAMELKNLMDQWNEHFTRNPNDTLISHWINDKPFENEEEYQANVIMLLFAGTHNLEYVLANAIRVLLLDKYKDQLEKIRQDPNLIPNAVEEIIRCYPSVRTLPRTAIQDLKVAGIEMKKGQTVLINVHEANRDPAVFKNPNVFDVTRPISESRKHMSFGFGKHLCIGNALARLELQTIIQVVLLDKMPNAVLLDQTEPVWEHSYSFVETLMLRPNLKK